MKFEVRINSINSIEEDKKKVFNDFYKWFKAETDKGAAVLKFRRGDYYAEATLRRPDGEIISTEVIPIG